MLHTWQSKDYYFSIYCWNDIEPVFDN